MMDSQLSGRIYRLNAPRMAAVAGILFAVFFTASVVLIRTAIPDSLTGGTEWVERGAKRLRFALALMPLAGVAFLWFVGVIRDHLKVVEDSYFSTAFLGSSLIFLAMVFVSMAIAGGIVASAQLSAGQALDEDVITFGRAVMLQINNVYALRMASICMTSLATVWWRTRLIPRWFAIITIVLAFILLVVINLSLWITLIFPMWVLAISVGLLVTNLRNKA
jgi:hypothetical protein